MPLKDFHKVFIVASIILCGFFGYWAWQRYSTQQTLGLLLTSIGSFALAAGLCVYGVYFIKKTRSM